MRTNNDVYFIDVFRNSFDRKISNYFQYNDVSNKTTYQMLDDINCQMFHIENYVSINEILDHFKLRHFTEFNFEKKYNLIKYKNVHIIKLRFIDINEWGTILSNILKKDVKIVNDNLSENKEYYKIYKEVKSIIKLNKETIDFLLEDPELNIYYSNSEKQQYEKYLNTFFIDGHYNFKNVPRDFIPSKYVELNNDINQDGYYGLSAKMHYEYYGFNEGRVYK